MQKKLILDSDLLDITISRLCQQLIEAHQDFSETVILGLQPRGVFFAEIIHQKLEKLLKKSIPLGYLDATFHRDGSHRHTWLQAAGDQIPLELSAVFTTTTRRPYDWLVHDVH